MKKLIRALNNNLIVQIVFFIGIMALLLGIYFASIALIKKEKIYKRIEVSDYEIVSNISEIREENDMFLISGSTFRFCSQIQEIDVVLEEQESRKLILLETSNTKSRDVTLAYDKDWDYGICGFQAEVEKNKINEANCYEILLNIKFKDNRTGLLKQEIKVSTLEYLYGGEIYSYNPKQYAPIEFKDESMAQVVNNGKLLLVSQEKGLYVFYYEGKLFWITDANFEFLIDGNTLIIYGLKSYEWSKQYNTLIGYAPNANDFVFEVNEYRFKEEEKYRVSVAEVPREYPVTYVKTGIYDVKNEIWHWDLDFKLMSDTDFGNEMDE